MDLMGNDFTSMKSKRLAIKSQEDPSQNKTTHQGIEEDRHKVLV